jgi:hypothetical protein
MVETKQPPMASEMEIREPESVFKGKKKKKQVAVTGEAEDYVYTETLLDQPAKVKTVISK